MAAPAPGGTRDTGAARAFPAARLLRAEPRRARRRVLAALCPARLVGRVLRADPGRDQARHGTAQSDPHMVS